MPLSAADITEIEQLVAAHYHHYDRRDPVPFADTFTEDGVLELGGRATRAAKPSRRGPRRSTSATARTATATGSTTSGSKARATRPSCAATS